jgi:hypothetical protein
MGYFRFRRYIRLFPGLRLNINKRSISASIGVRGAHYTISPKGTRATVGLPGSGLSYTDQKPWPKALAPPPAMGPWGPRLMNDEGRIP